MFRQIRMSDIGCASYLIGDGGQCAVIDPRWDVVRNYVGLARNAGLEITHIIETHVHADHVSGGTRLAERTGATIHIHRDADVSYFHEDLNDGDVIQIGSIDLSVLHTPGHSVDSISLLVRDRAKRVPDSILTGDTLFTWRRRPSRSTWKRGRGVGSRTVRQPSSAASLAGRLGRRLSRSPGRIPLRQTDRAGSIDHHRSRADQE